MDIFEEYSESELLLTDIQFLGLNQGAWEFNRGARTTRDYTDDSDNLLVRDSFSYTLTNSDRDVATLTRQIEWFNSSGTAEITKDTTPTISQKQLKAVNREIRQGRLDYLESAAENLRTIAETLSDPLKSQYISIADSIDALFVHYGSEVTHYIQRGTLEFENAVNGETDATILAVLALPSRPADAEFPVGLTVKQSILYQLTGVIPT